MEIQCPECNQRLRVADGMKNPLLRCTKCGSKFRLQETLSDDREQLRESGRWYPPAAPLAGSPAETRRTRLEPQPDPANRQWVEADPVVEVVDEAPYSQLERRSGPTLSEKTKSFASSTLGTVFLFLVIVLFKGGPRLAQMFFRNRPQQAPPPVQLDQDRLEQLRRMNHAQRQRAIEQFRRQKNAEAPDVK